MESDEDSTSFRNPPTNGNSAELGNHQISEGNNQDSDHPEHTTNASTIVDGEINDIFGESEDEDIIDIVSEDEYHVDNNDVDETDANPNFMKRPAPSTQNQSGNREDDIDYLLNRNKRYRQQQRKRNSDILDNRDKYAGNVINLMMKAAEHDRKMNAERKSCFGKLNLLPKISIELLRPELAESYVDHGIFEAFAAWLQVLPSGDLPMLNIRSKILRLIQELPTPSTEDLKLSGLGKIMTMLSRHPKEVRKNKNIAQNLIDKWIRPIYGLDGTHESYQSGIKRVEVNIEDLRKEITTKSFKNNNEDDTESESRPKPGDPNFIMRARAPQPSSREYKIRPVSVLSTTKSAAFLRAKKAENTKKYFNRLIRKNTTTSAKKVAKVNINGGKFFG